MSATNMPAVSSPPRGDLENAPRPFPSTAEEALTLPKHHPARFLFFYGNCRNVQPQSEESVRAIKAVLRSASLELYYQTHPFGRDLQVCAETNS